jgi:CRP-like cAMP-binding protein
MTQELLSFTIPGNPVTKKTHQRIMRVGGYPRIFPSKQYEEYEKYGEIKAKNQSSMVLQSR